MTRLSGEEDRPLFKTETYFTKDTLGRKVMLQKFKCPSCGQTNRHGAPDGYEASHRNSHCECWKPKGYFVQPDA